MFQKTSPEKVGIRPEKLRRFFEKLEDRGLFMHSVLMARGKDIFCEAYWSPFTERSLHRMYSATKSFVGVAVCELAAENRISLEDKIIRYFPDKLPASVHPFLAAMTVKNMLTMQTCMPNGNWFAQNVSDRVEHYFHRTPVRYPGTGFDYDSEGSFVLGALVERVTGKTLLTYLREKCLDEIGFSAEAYCLQAPGGHTWGDSALLCTPRDLLAFGRLVANGGEWNGKQLLNAEYLAQAVAKQSDTVSGGLLTDCNRGYGYQIWNCFDGSFAFEGMHDQLMLYHPKTDILFVCTGGNPHGLSCSLILEYLFADIIEGSLEKPIKADEESRTLERYLSGLSLRVAQGQETSVFKKEIDGKTYTVKENRMGITEFTLRFDKTGGSFTYYNKQGKKEIRFGRKTNVIQPFPQTGYSKEIGGKPCEGHTYRCAVSGAWAETKKLSLLVQVIDDYIGLLHIMIGFQDGYAFLDMRKCAENFLDEYQGSAVAERNGEII